MTEMNDEFLTAVEAAQVLGVSDATVRNRIADGSIMAKKWGREWRIPRSEVERMGAFWSEEGERLRTKKPNETNDSSEKKESTERNSNSPQWEMERLRVKLETSERENSHLLSEVEHLRSQVLEQSQSIRALTEQNQRLTLLLANEQALRLPALPRPLGWIGRLFRRHAEA